jgi:hypothetical protein
MEGGRRHQVNPGQGRFKSTGAVDDIRTHNQQQITTAQFRPIVRDGHDDLGTIIGFASRFPQNRDPTQAGFSAHDPEGKALKQSHGTA